MRVGIRAIIFTALVCGILGGTYALVVEPHLHQRRQMRKEIASMTAAIESLTRTTGELEHMEEAVNRQDRALAFYQTQLPDAGDANKAIPEITEMAGANSLQTVSIRAGDPRPRGQYVSQPMELCVNGDFNGFYSFLQQLEKLPHTIRVPQMSIDTANDIPGDVHAVMTIEVVQMAQARPTSEETPVSHETLDGFLRNGSDRVLRIQQGIARGERSIQTLTGDKSVAQVPLAELAANPFRVGSAVPAPASADRLTLLKAVDLLQLQSIVRGDTAENCLINGTLYHEGQQVNEFTVDTINEQSVIVRCGDYRFELKPPQ